MTSENRQAEKGRRERRKRKKREEKIRARAPLTPDVGDRSVATSRHQQATQRRRARLAGGVQHGVSIFVHGVELVVTPRHVEGERDGAVVAGPGGLQRSAETRKKTAGEEGRASAGKDRRERERRKERRTKKRKGYAYLQRSSFSSGPHPAPTVVQRSRRQPFLHVARRIPKSKVRVKSVEEMTGVAESRLLSVHADRGIWKNRDSSATGGVASALFPGERGGRGVVSTPPVGVDTIDALPFFSVAEGSLVGI